MQLRDRCQGPRPTGGDHGPVLRTVGDNQGAGDDVAGANEPAVTVAVHTEDLYLLGDPASGGEPVQPDEDLTDREG
jgi:hypothetical protein